MADKDSFVLNYDPISRNVRFSIRKSTGVNNGILDNEPLKDYENTDGKFTLDGQYGQLFDYIRENFEGKPEIILRIETSQDGHDKFASEFNRFEERVGGFNKTNGVKIVLNIHKTRTEAEQSAAEAGAPPEAEELDNEPYPPVKIAVAGKISSGKASLIEGLTEYNKSKCSVTRLPGNVTVYSDTVNNIIWYKLRGIDYEEDSISRSRSQLEALIKDEGVSVILYCLNERAGTMENSEGKLINHIKQRYPEVSVYAVITQSLSEETSAVFAEAISRMTRQTRVFPVLAKEMQLKSSIMPVFGLAGLSKAIYGDMA